MAKKCVECMGKTSLVRGTRKGVEYSTYKCEKCGMEIMTLGQASSYLDAAQSAKIVSLSMWGRAVGLRIPATIAKKFNLRAHGKAMISEKKTGFLVTPLQA